MYYIFTWILTLQQKCAKIHTSARLPSGRLRLAREIPHFRASRANTYRVAAGKHTGVKRTASREQRNRQKPIQGNRTQFEDT